MFESRTGQRIQQFKIKVGRLAKNASGLIYHDPAKLLFVFAKKRRGSNTFFTEVGTCNNLHVDRFERLFALINYLSENQPNEVGEVD
jgi:hypothetical protein